LLSAGRFRASSLALLFVSRIPALGRGTGGLVPTALCATESRCTTPPFRFMQIAELGEMHTGVRVGDSRSFVSVKSARVLRHAAPQNSRRLNVARISRQFDTHCRGDHRLTTALIIDSTTPRRLNISNGIIAGSLSYSREVDPSPRIWEFFAAPTAICVKNADRYIRGKARHELVKQRSRN